MGFVCLLGGGVVALTLLSMLTSFLIIRKFENGLINTSLKKTFNFKTNFMSRKVFIVICSTIVSFMSLGVTSATIASVKLSEKLPQDAIMLLSMQIFFGLLMLIYDLDVLFDKRERLNYQ